MKWWIWLSTPARSNTMYNKEGMKELFVNAYMLRCTGLNVTTEFCVVHRRQMLNKYTRLKVGRMDGATVDATLAAGTINIVPFADIPAMQGQSSPYCKTSHCHFMLPVRHFMHTELKLIAESSGFTGERPDHEPQKKLDMAKMRTSHIGPWIVAEGRLGAGHRDPW